MHWRGETQGQGRKGAAEGLGQERGGRRTRRGTEPEHGGVREGQGTGQESALTRGEGQTGAPRCGSAHHWAMSVAGLRDLISLLLLIERCQESLENFPLGPQD